MQIFLSYTTKLQQLISLGHEVKVAFLSVESTDFVRAKLKLAKHYFLLICTLKQIKAKHLRLN